MRSQYSNNHQSRLQKHRVFVSQKIDDWRRGEFVVLLLAESIEAGVIRWLFYVLVDLTGCWSGPWYFVRSIAWWIVCCVWNAIRCVETSDGYRAIMGFSLLALGAVDFFFCYIFLVVRLLSSVLFIQQSAFPTSRRSALFSIARGADYMCISNEPSKSSFTLCQLFCLSLSLSFGFGFSVRCVSSLSVIGWVQSHFIPLISLLNACVFWVKNWLQLSKSFFFFINPHLF